MNTAGFFNDDYTTYTITSMFPPRPWRNYLFNDRFLICCDQFGIGGSWDTNPDGTRSFCAGGADNRLIYIRDNNDGSYWAANRNYKREKWEVFFCEVGVGYSNVVSKHKGIRTSFKLFVPTEGLVECWSVEIENTGDSKRDISFYPYMESTIPGIRIPACNGAFFEPEMNAIFHYNRNVQNNIPFPTMFFAAEFTPDKYDTTNRRFRGVYGSNAHPDTLEGDGQLASLNTSFDHLMAAVMQYDTVLEPGEKKTFRFVAGLVDDPKNAPSIVNGKLSAHYYEEELQRLHNKKQRYRERFCISTPDDDINAFGSVWLKQQVNLGKTFGRVSGLRFRDSMQDIAAYIPLDPSTARERILHILTKQYPNGNTPRQWIPFDERLYRDGSAWIAETVCQYIKETGEFDLLKEEIPYLRSDEKGSVLDHMMRGHEFLYNETGEHGLCLWGEGDWNDSINAAGVQGKGESVWLSLATVASSRIFAGLLSRAGDNEKATYINVKADEMQENILKYSWDGEYFICGFNDYGEKIGSRENVAGRIFLICQAWAVLAGISEGKEGQILMDIVEKEMECPWGYMLSYPSFDNGRDSNEHIGRITYMEKGSYENGSVYNHGVCFKAAADCKLGRGELAYKTIKKILPSNPENPSLKSGCEPYVITNMYLGPENPCRAGHSINPWTTGTAGWLLRCINEYMIGVIADYDGLAIRPVLNSKWKEISVRREFRNAVYNIKIMNPKGLETGALCVTMDGRKMDTNILPPVGDGKEHEVIVEIG
ncbi:MAG: hypothetical protein GF401_18515 [Chitinivibrionales bacterium]|nr:hypothetical protein [Chitinivibrionales bacterium]